MKPRSIFFNIHINDTVTKDPQKRYVLLNYQKTFSGKKSQFFRHFSYTTIFLNKIFYQKNTFLQTEVKVELQINL